MWLHDSGASHHITSDLSNLSLHSPYNCGESVMIENGTEISITHISSAILPLLSRNLSLNNILCVLDMRNNLISVKKFCKK